MIGLIGLPSTSHTRARRVWWIGHLLWDPVEPPVGIEPTTYSLPGKRSAGAAKAAEPRSRRAHERGYQAPRRPPKSDPGRPELVGRMCRTSITSRCGLT